MHRLFCVYAPPSIVHRTCMQRVYVRKHTDLFGYSGRLSWCFLVNELSASMDLSISEYVHSFTAMNSNGLNHLPSIYYTHVTRVHLCIEGQVCLRAFAVICQSDCRGAEESATLRRLNCDWCRWHLLHTSSFGRPS